MTTYEQILTGIVKRQMEVIGPIALEVAETIPGLKLINKNDLSITITAEPKSVINILINQYENIFGKLSVMQCKQSVLGLMNKLSIKELPDSLLYIDLELKRK